MSSSGSASFALDAYHRLSNRLDVIQDRLASEIHSPALSESEEDERRLTATTTKESQKQQDLIRIESTFNSQIIQSKSLLDNKQIDQALKTLNDARSLNARKSSVLFLNPPSTISSQNRAQLDLVSDHTELFELIAGARLTYSVYGTVLNDLLKQAESVNEQAWYWTEVQEDPIQTLTYLIQTLPERVANLVFVIGKKLSDTTITPLTTNSQSKTSSTSSSRETTHLPINAQTLQESWKIIRNSPILAIGALFPLSVNEDQKEQNVSSFSQKSTKKKRPQLVSAIRILTPLALTRHEARSKKSKLMKKRDELATKVGILSQALSKVDSKDTQNISVDELQAELWQRVKEMQSVLDDDAEFKEKNGMDLSNSLQNLVNTHLREQKVIVEQILSNAPKGLGSPSRLARIWPVLVLGPIASLITLRIITRSWDTIIAKAEDARETVRGFFVNWVYDPCLKLLDTIRTGDQEGGMIISPESLNSDLQSLERMVSDFNREQYGLKGKELEEITEKVRQGDLTTVLKIYENELKSPLRSAVSGNLIRSLLIQIQKVKVDIAVAMRGVDQLLKSQQLLFGAIGIAPAMGILYVFGGFMRTRMNVLLGYQERRKVGENYQFRAWEAMRRIDKLLSDPQLSTSSNLPPLTQGLLLLDLALLRKLAPDLISQGVANSRSIGGGGNRATRTKRLRAEFFNDVRDLEMSKYEESESSDGKQQNSNNVENSSFNNSLPGLGWHSRRAAVDRMWKSWGHFISITTSS